MVVTAGTIGGYDSEDPSSKLNILKNKPASETMSSESGFESAAD